MNNLRRVLITVELQDAYRDLLEAAKKNNENALQRKLAIFLDRAERNEGIEGEYFEELRESYSKGNSKERLIVASKFGGEPCKHDGIYHHDWMTYLAALKDTGILDEEVYDEAMKRLDYIFEPEQREEKNDN